MHIVFDIGGTNMRIGSSRDGETLDRTTIIKTPTSYEEGIAEFKKAAWSLADGEGIDVVAGGLAGMYSKKHQKLLAAPNLGAWVNKPVATELMTVFNAPVYIENDAAVDGLGEAWHGAGRGFDIVAYMTVSTGVGGARIVGGKIDEKSLSFEPGHQIIDVDKSMIPNASGVSLESYISGRALTERMHKKPKEVNEPEVWEGLARMLTVGVSNLISFWSPDVVVLGGSMITGDPAISLDRVRDLLPKVAGDQRILPEIKIAELGDIGGLHGALEYIKQCRGTQ